MSIFLSGPYKAMKGLCFGYFQFKSRQSTQIIQLRFVLSIGHKFTFEDPVCEIHGCQEVKFGCSGVSGHSCVYGKLFEWTVQVAINMKIEAKIFMYHFRFNFFFHFVFSSFINIQFKVLYFQFQFLIFSFYMQFFQFTF